MKCRHCENPDLQKFVDLGFAPPSNAYLPPNALQQPELTYPLRIFACPKCWLVQTEDYTTGEELFTPDYAYFSSTSQSWLAHAERYSREIVERLGLTSESMVLEIASNDGYLLQNFVAVGIPCLGIEPTKKAAEIAQKKGVPVLMEFFGDSVATKLLEQGKSADLVIGNNVYAHVPNINDFTKGIEKILKPDGVVTLEFPHLFNLVQQSQFDTIYHEHFSYLSLLAVKRIFESFGLKVFDVEKIPTHGGSLRVYGAKKSACWVSNKSVDEVLDEECSAGLGDLSIYKNYQDALWPRKYALLEFLLDNRKRGKLVCGYGAAAKANTILNFSGVTPDLLPYVFDAAESKQGRLMPGSHIPILPPEEMERLKPDYILILPWNIQAEIIGQLKSAKTWGGKFVQVFPKLRVLE